MKRRLALLLAALLAGGANAGWAQIGDCPALARDPSSLKVVLGDVTTPGGAAQGDEIRRSLTFKLQTSAEALALTEGERKLRAAVCTGHKPQDETEFNQGTVEELSRLGVVLEVWGSVVPAPDAPAQREARLNFAVVSLLRFEPVQPGFHDVVYPTTGAGTLGVLRDNVELEALATLAAAIRYRRDGGVDAAARALCEALSHLTRSAQGADAIRRPRWTALRDYALKSRAALVAAALQPDAAPSRLKITGDRGCPQ
jgi:hypothetical protein